MKLLSVLPLVGAAAALPQSSSASSSSVAPSSSSSGIVKPTDPATPPSLGAFGVVAAHSGSPIHLSPMNANSTSFWIGKKTSAYCPPNVPEMGGVCPPGKDTVLVGGSALNVEVPGGQQVYIAPGGALKFTAPHSASMPPGSIKSGFEYEPGNPFGHWTWKGQSGSGWMACPADGAYQVFANVKDAEVPSGNVADCIGFDAMAVADKSNSPAAWEYA